SSRRRHTRFSRDWSSDVCSSDLANVWGFGTDSTVGRWVRRMLVETGVHRWDAQHAFGEATPLTGLVAATALDEFSSMWAPLLDKIGRASCRERVQVTVADAALKD